MADILYGVKLVVLNELDPVTQNIKAGGVSCKVTTAESAELESVISNGEEKVLRDDTQILAIARTPDLLYGYTLKLTDNTFDVNVASLVEGGTIRRDGSNNIIGYDSPKLADGATMKPFAADIYVANYEGDSIKNYTKITLNNCTGKAPKLTFKKDFFSPEFEIDAREATKAGKPIKSIDYVDALPSDDTTPPTVTLVSVSPVTKPEVVTATSDKIGGLYLVIGTATVDSLSDLSALVNVGLGAYASVASVNTNVDLATSGLATTGEFKVYAVDAAGNISTPVDITIN